MDKKRNKNTIGLITLLIAIIGIVSPILWDNFKNRTEITVSLLYNSTLLKDNISLPDLSVTYKGNSIINITKAEFSIKNTGKVPILSSDIISPISLIPDKGQIIASQIERSIPDNLISHVYIDNKNSNVDFDLLNPGDAIFVNILVNSGDVKFTTAARIKNISNIKMIDESHSYKMVKNIDWLFIVVSLGTVISILGLIAFLSSLNNGNDKIIANLSNNDYIRKNIFSKEQYISYIEQFIITDEKQKNEFIKLKNDIENNWSEQNVFDFTTKILKIFNKENYSNMGMIFILLVFSILGIYFCVRYFI